MSSETLPQADTLKNIVLVDDHVVVRSGLQQLIEKLGPYRVLNDFSSGEELMEAFPFREAIDLIIMDYYLPTMNGDEILKKLNDCNVTIPVLMLTLNHDELLITKLFRLGVRGYLEKNCSANVLKQALNEIFECGYYHNEFLIKALTNSDQSRPNERERIKAQLTAKELHFLQLVCDEKEYTYEQIAVMMGVVRRTVDGYRESIFFKFDIKSKVGLVLFAFKHRLLE